MRTILLAVFGFILTSVLSPPFISARSSPSIASAIVDYAHSTLTVSGSNFGLHPKVRLGNVTLTVQSATRTEIVAAFPSASPLSSIVPGTYVLNIAFPKGSRAGFPLGLGATGPAGPQGPQGPTCPAAASSLETGKWGFGLVYGFVAWVLSRLIELSKSRTKEARDACGRLRTLMSEWIDGINDAVKSESNREATLQKLATFRSRHNFEPRLQEVETYLREEGRACLELINRADTFHDGALRAKGIIAEILGSASDQDYELRKPVILKQLENLYGRVGAELTRVTEFLQVKQTRIVPWFGPREPMHAN